MLKILIADDAELLRRRMISLLSRVPGVTTILESVDCAGTLAAIEQEQPDVVLLDLRLPDGSGLDVLRELEGRAQRPRVLVLTTWSGADVRQRCLDAGAENFFEKGTGFMAAVDAVEAMAAGTAA